MSDPRHDMYNPHPRRLLRATWNAREVAQELCSVITASVRLDGKYSNSLPDPEVRGTVQQAAVNGRNGSLRFVVDTTGIIVATNHV